MIGFAKFEVTGVKMSDSVLRTKSKSFAKDVVFLCRALKQNGAESALINQLLRSGTSVGANIHEAQYAQGVLRHTQTVCLVQN